MATRRILFDGDEALRKKCREVALVDDHIRLLLEDMMDTLHLKGSWPNAFAMSLNIWTESFSSIVR